MAIDMDAELHRKTAKSLFNHVWSLLDNKTRTIQENDEMIHAAHASRYHWGIVGTPINLARGEWQISRVYAVLQRESSAIYHAKRCLDICLEHQLGDFDLAYAYEALARAYHIAGESENKLRFLTLSKESGNRISKKEDHDLLIGDLATIPV